jgi:hypothetical protein
MTTHSQAAAKVTLYTHREAVHKLLKVLLRKQQATKIFNNFAFTFYVTSVTDILGSGEVKRTKHFNASEERLNS